MPTTYPGYNVTDSFAGITALVPGSPSAAAANSSNLNKMVLELIEPSGVTNGQGGTLDFPAVGTYYFDGTINVGFDSAMPPNYYPSSVIFKGTGEQNRAKAALQQVTLTDDFFTVNNSPSGSPQDQQIGGIIFQDLIIQYASSPEQAASVIS